jgi:hypothetical protein
MTGTCRLGKFNDLQAGAGRILRSKVVELCESWARAPQASGFRLQESGVEEE